MRRRTWVRASLLALCVAGAAFLAITLLPDDDAAILDEPWPQDLPRPADPVEAARLKQEGVAWTNRQVRRLYLERVATIAGDDAEGRAAGLSAEARARRAYATRHDARMTARAMMADPAEVALLQARDREKYGDPDGPSFELLVERARAKGLAGDAIYESIVESAQRTDAETNRRNGL